MLNTKIYFEMFPRDKTKDHSSSKHLCRRLYPKVIENVLILIHSLEGYKM